ncbi:MAG: pyrroline-5-carboxylate reductase [Caldisphaera sp.]|nr:MAG: pyrroline-5-carboxylate reductase [Caldisphaera sp.]PMP89172.1 MAG: pyrroline-5-carboxylate reductase [Caldisphaera sp.]
MVDRSLAILGAGVIGSSIIRSLIGSGKDWKIIATARSDESLNKIKKMGIDATRDNIYAVKNSDVIILAIKPSQLINLADEISPFVKEKLIISVVAAAPIKWLSKKLTGAKIVRAMPNINSETSSSFTVLSTNSNIDAASKKLVEEIFSSIGYYEWVDEKYMNALTALSGSAPAFLAEIIDALALGGIASGLPRDLAYKAVLYTMQGTAKTLLEKGWSPHYIRDLVITPAGTTIRGIMVLQGNGLKRSIMEAVLEAQKKADEIENYLFNS